MTTPRSNLQESSSHWRRSGSAFIKTSIVDYSYTIVIKGGVKSGIYRSKTTDNISSDDSGRVSIPNKYSARGY